MSPEESRKKQEDQVKEFMESPFIPSFDPQHVPSNEDRIVSALEYIAHQLGAMNRKLDKLLQR